jgi:flagellar biogenesis protein FliO
MKPEIRNPKSEIHAERTACASAFASTFSLQPSSFLQHTQLLASRVPGVAPWLRLAALVGFLLPVTAQADPASSASSFGLPDAGTSLLRVCGAMLVVFAVFFGLVWLYRNWQRVLRRTGRMPLLNVTEARSLGNRHTLYVVACGDQRFLIGSSPTGLSLLSQLPTLTSVTTTTLVTDPATGNRTQPLATFADTLQALMERK